MATLHHGHTGDAFIFLKCAPERLLEMCAYKKTVNGDQSVDSEHRVSPEISGLAAHKANSGQFGHKTAVVQ